MNSARGVRIVGRPFIAMQHVAGRLLSEGAPSLSLEQKVLLVRQVVEAVQAAHAAGLVHRDLKPGRTAARFRTAGAETRS